MIGVRGRAPRQEDVLAAAWRRVRAASGNEERWLFAELWVRQDFVLDPTNRRSVDVAKCHRFGDRPRPTETSWIVDDATERYGRYSRTPEPTPEDGRLDVGLEA